VVADPRSIGLAKLAAVHLRHRVGTDVALLNGMMHVILEKGWENEAFIAERTENVDALKEIVAAYPPKKVAGLCGVDEPLLRKAAQLYANSEKAMILYAMGITQHITGTDNVKTLANLAMLTGHVGFPSTGVNPLRGQNNVQGACDMGALPNVYTGYQRVNDDIVTRKFEEAWGTEGLSRDPGLTVTEMVHAAGTGEVKGLYILGENPVVSDPDARHAERSLKKLDFLVVQDLFLTETAQYAHVILPALSFAEKEGTFTNTERRVQLSRQAMAPIKGCMEEWKVFCEISTRAGYPMNYENPKEILDEINTVTPSYTGITWKRIENSWGLPWPCPDKHHPGTPFLHKDVFARGLGHFEPREYIPPAELPDDQYPFVLTTGRVGPQFHTGTMTRKVSILEREAPRSVLEMNPEDARALRIREGNLVAVKSRRGELRLPVHVTPDVPEGSVFGTFHYCEGNINELTICAIDPVAKIPEYKSCAVSIRRV
jgi:predicted molibdopterin-dependent oxidoreductase YjgC